MNECYLCGKEMDKTYYLGVEIKGELLGYYNYHHVCYKCYIHFTYSPKNIVNDYIKENNISEDYLK